MEYDYLIVGAGLFGAVFAHEMREKGKNCLVIDKRNHLAGNIYTEERNGIRVHKYGAHIFHTSDERVWNYICRFARFNHYVNSPVAVYQDELYNLPFNMNTFHALWGVRTPAEAKEKLAEQKGMLSLSGEPANLEEQALSLVGPDVYTRMIKGYTEKQWGRDCKELPAFIIKRIPLRFVYDNNYFTDTHQGIPVDGYTNIVEKLLEGVQVRLGISYQDFLTQNQQRGPEADRFAKVLYTGMIDEFYDYCYGPLQYRSLRFEEQLLEGCENYQGNAVVNYTEREVPFTRIIEHKHFEFGTQPDTVITREYPAAWKQGEEPFYPINDEENNALYARYKALADAEEGVLFGGRLGQYRYYDMDKVIAAALDMVENE